MTIWFPIGHFLLVVLWNQVSIANGFQDIQRRIWRSGWHDLTTTSKQRSRAFIFVPIDFSYMTSRKLSIVTFALWRTNGQRHRQTTTTDRRSTVARPLVRSAKTIDLFDYAKSQETTSGDWWLLIDKVKWAVRSPMADFFSRSYYSYSLSSVDVCDVMYCG